MAKYSGTTGAGALSSFAFELAFLTVVVCGVLATVQAIALNAVGGYAILAQQTTLEHIDRGTTIEMAMLLSGPILAGLWCLRLVGRRRRTQQAPWGLVVDERGLHRTFAERDPHVIEWGQVESLVWNRSTGELEVGIRDTGSGSGPIRFDLSRLRARSRGVVGAVEKHSGRTVEPSRAPGSPAVRIAWRKIGITAVVGLVALVCVGVTVLTWGEGLASGWTDTGWIRDALPRTLGGMAVGPLAVAVLAVVMVWAVAPDAHGPRRERRSRG
ncbi:hypothetical protein [Brachybacterium sp. YJGR34]|uniref:hypothetical protein n=1 Tax=Brachybacterium sp. YJGR34 TaxID=2059911 RepID=UPI000E0CA807|nr:hypothetical protein [Brachybacterium sp. YJGR34]